MCMKVDHFMQLGKLTFRPVKSSSIPGRHISSDEKLLLTLVTIPPVSLQARVPEVAGGREEGGMRKRWRNEGKTEGW